MKRLGWILFLLMSASMYGTVAVKYSDGWIVEVADIDSTALQPIIIKIAGESDNETEMFFIDEGESVELNLSLSDGAYNYVIADRDLNLIEEGALNLSRPVDIEIGFVSNSAAGLILSGDESVYMECYLYKDDSPVDYLRCSLDGEETVVFEDLEAGTDYRAEFNTDGFIMEVGFTTPNRNVALNRPVTGTFNRLPESQFIDDSTPAITRINDGLIEWYSGMAVSGEVNFEEQYALVNFLSPVNLGKVRVVWSGNYYPLKYYFVYSTDGEEWASVERSADEYESETAGDNTPLMTDTFFVDVSAVYAGVLIEKGQEIYSRMDYKNTIQLMELEFYE